MAHGKKGMLRRRAARRERKEANKALWADRRRKRTSRTLQRSNFKHAVSFCGNIGCDRCFYTIPGTGRYKR